MTEMQTLEIRFPGRLLAACRDKRGAVERLNYHDDNDYFVVYKAVPGGPADQAYYVVYHDVPGDEAWLEDGHGNGLTRDDIRRDWPDLAKAARLD